LPRHPRRGKETAPNASEAKRVSTPSTYDVVIIGAGHNGLTCAAYLGQAGLSVKVVERRGVVGGAAVTEEFHPGFRNSVAAYTVSLLNPKVIRDLKLHEHGLRIVERRAANFLPAPDGRYLLAGEGRTKAEVARHNPRDGERYDAFAAEIDAVADVLRDLVLRAPPNVVEGFNPRTAGELIKAAALGRQLGGLSMASRRALLDLFTKSAADYLDGWFEGDLVKALYGFDAVVGNYASPHTPGTAYVLLHHAFGEVNGKKGAWGHAIGGMGAITQAMARAARAAGVAIETDAPVEEVIVEKGGAPGVRLADGRTIRARAVAANVNPKLLYTRMMPADAVPADVLARMRRWRVGSGTFRMNVALSELPSFTALPGRDRADHHTAGIILAPSLAYMDRAYTDAAPHGWSREPIVEMLIPSTLDDSLAPKGAHVASLFLPACGPGTPGRRLLGRSPRDGGGPHDRHGRPLRAGFKASVLGRQVLSPLDLERTFGLTAATSSTARCPSISSSPPGRARPRRLPRARWRASTIAARRPPGGGVTGAPGHNARRVIAGSSAGGGHRRRARGCHAPSPFGDLGPSGDLAAFWRYDADQARRPGCRHRTTGGSQRISAGPAEVPYDLKTALAPWWVLRPPCRRMPIRPRRWAPCARGRARDPRRWARAHHRLPHHGGPGDLAHHGRGTLVQGHPLAYDYASASASCRPSAASTRRCWAWRIPAARCRHRRGGGGRGRAPKIRVGDGGGPAGICRLLGIPPRRRHLHRALAPPLGRHGPHRPQGRSSRHRLPAIAAPGVRRARGAPQHDGADRPPQTDPRRPPHPRPGADAAAALARALRRRGRGAGGDHRARGEGPAKRAGLRAGDIIRAVAGQTVLSLNELYRGLWALGAAGVDVPLTIEREGDQFDVTVTSGDRSRFMKTGRLH
jgi:phytoene dehydrogenase-like protein